MLRWYRYEDIPRTDRDCRELPKKGSSTGMERKNSKW